MIDEFDLERYLINTLISYPEEISSVELIPENFAFETYGMIFAELIGMSAKGMPVDVATLSYALTASGNLQRIGGERFLMEICETLSASPAFIPEHARIIRERSKRKEMRLHLLRALEAVQDKSTPLTDVVSMAEAAALAGVAETTGRGLRHAKTYLKEVYEIMERQSKKEITGLKTGFYDLDLHLSGLQKSDLIILGGRPRMGKTALATDIAANVAIEQNKSVAFFELEMSGRQIIERHVYARARVNGQLLRSGRLSASEYPKLTEPATPVINSQWYIDDTVGLTPLGIRSKCLKHRYKHGLNLVVVDNIQKMKGDGKYEGNRRLEIADITNNLKNLAKDLDVPIIAISHLSRGPDMRADHEPVLSDLQESGNIEQDADIVIFLYREEVYEDVPPEKKGECKVIFSKYRNGQEGYKLLRFNEDFACFENWAGNRTEPQESYRTRQSREDF